MKNVSNASQEQIEFTPEPIAVGVAETANGSGSAIIATDSIDGCPVVNAQEEYIGEVAHLMIVVPEGQIAYVVVSSGGVLGIGNKLHAIPWSALVFDEANDRFTLDIDQEDLENAPSFDKEHWPVMSDHEWGTQIHDYYGQRNYWLRPNDRQAQAG